MKTRTMHERNDNGLDLLIRAKQRANGCNTTSPPNVAVWMRITGGPPAEDVGGQGKEKG